MSIWPTNIVVTRNRVTSDAVVRRWSTTSVTPTSAVAARTACSSVPVRRPIRLSSPRTSANLAWTSDSELGAPPDDVGLAEARSQVVAPGDALLHGCGVVGPRLLLLDLAGRERGQQRAGGEPVRPSRRAGTGGTPATTWSRRRPTAARTPAGCGSPARRSAGAACRPRGCRRRPGPAPRRPPAPSAPAAAGAGQRRAGQRAAGPRRGRRPRPTACAPRCRGGPLRRRTAASHPDQLCRGLLGQPSGEQRAQGGAHGCDGARQQRPCWRRDCAACASRRFCRGPEVAPGSGPCGRTPVG